MILSRGPFHLAVRASALVKDRLIKRLRPHFSIADTDCETFAQITVIEGGPERLLNLQTCWKTPDWTVRQGPPEQFYVSERSLSWAARLVRELYRVWLWTECAALPVHAACVSYNGHGLLLAGEKGAGKTTTCMSLVNQGGSFVTNDDALISGDERALFCSGSLRKTNVRPDTDLWLSPQAGSPDFRNLIE